LSTINLKLSTSYQTLDINFSIFINADILDKMHNFFFLISALCATFNSDFDFMAKLLSMMAMSSVLGSIITENLSNANLNFHKRGLLCKSSSLGSSCEMDIASEPQHDTSSSVHDSAQTANQKKSFKHITNDKANMQAFPLPQIYELPGGQYQCAVM
jgi:hypothetical protein